MALFHIKEVNKQTKTKPATSNLRESAKIPDKLYALT